MNTENRIKQFGYDPKALAKDLDINRRVGAFFRQLRTKFGKSLNDIEVETGIPSSEIQGWESGFTSPLCKRVYKVVTCLGMEAMLEASVFYNEMNYEAQLKIRKLKDESIL